MWDDFGRSKSGIYTDYKFRPTHRVGLTNYLREEQIWICLEPGDDDVVLDVGCASGRQLLGIADRIKAGYGTDIAHTFIEKAEQGTKEKGVLNLTFKQARIERLPFEDAFFDKIICAEVLEHVHDKDKALGELLRILKPGGRLIVTVPNLNADGTLWGRLLRLLRVRSFVALEDFSLEELTRHGDAHVREFTRKSLVGWLRANNLEVVAVKSVSFIDGPGFDFPLKVLLHIPVLQKGIIRCEQALTRMNLLLGRHLIVQAKRI